MIIHDIARLSELHRMLRRVATTDGKGQNISWCKDRLRRLEHGDALRDDEAGRVLATYDALFPIIRERGDNAPQTLLVDEMASDQEMEALPRQRQRSARMVIP